MQKGRRKFILRPLFVFESKITDVDATLEASYILTLSSASNIKNCYVPSN